ncbi:uncharacterized protein LOC112453444 [Temnothorax curvispinosus]|uniref:Uncharacterized protein LOC112453444 n=1 Tax=Temnothorax curvispinosus TaxID=300111 RepID=A0A6J1PK50_9HYME|nr:uncharacterized protein LOC112453444 [Temnothorax curvispinosus]
MSTENNSLSLDEQAFDEFARGVSQDSPRPGTTCRGVPSAKRHREEDMPPEDIVAKKTPSPQDVEMEESDVGDLRVESSEHDEESGTDEARSGATPTIRDEQLVSRDMNLAVATAPDDLNREYYIVKDNTLTLRDPNIDDHRFQKPVKFDDDFPGKAIIVLRLPQDQTTIKKGKNLIKIWMILNELTIIPVSVTMINHYSAEALFKDIYDANSALEKINSLKNPVKLTANVEQRNVICKGVISDWPSSIPALWDNICDRSRIVSLERMLRRKWDPNNNKTTYCSTDNIIITFKDSNIRNLAIFASGIGLRVRPFVQQVRQCFNCYKFGHTKLNCKSETRCIVCGDKAHGQCDETRCCNCGGAHRSTYRKCPAFEKNRNINVVMAQRNISFHSARRIVEGEVPPSTEFQNKFLDQRPWPALRPTSSYAEAVRGPNRPLPTPRQGPTRGETRAAPRNFYKSFNPREGEITKDRWGILLANREADGSSKSRDDGPDDPASLEKQRILNSVEMLIDMLRRTPDIRAVVRRALEQTNFGGSPGESSPSPPSQGLYGTAPVPGVVRSRGFRPHKNELSKISMDYDIVVLTETRCSARRGVYLPGFKTLNGDNALGSGGVAVAVRSHIRFDIIRLGGMPVGYDVLGISTSNLRKNFNIFAVYRHPRTNIGPRDLREIMNSADGYSGQRDSNIDLLFADGDLAGEIEYSQLEETCDSDHVPIAFSFNTGEQVYEKLSNRISSKKTDWEKYQEAVEGRMRHLFADISDLGSDFSGFYQSFVRAVKSSVEEATGRRGRASGGRKISHRWWNADCDAAIAERRRAFQAFKKTRDTHTWHCYKRSCAVVKKTLCRAKENFETFCQFINRFTSLPYVWNTLRILKNARSRIEWNKWQTKNREAEIRRTIDSTAQKALRLDQRNTVGRNL